MMDEEDSTEHNFLTHLSFIIHLGHHLSHKSIEVCVIVCNKQKDRFRITFSSLSANLSVGPACFSVFNPQPAIFEIF